MKLLTLALTGLLTMPVSAAELSCMQDGKPTYLFSDIAPNIGTVVYVNTWESSGVVSQTAIKNSSLERVTAVVCDAGTVEGEDQ